MVIRQRLNSFLYRRFVKPVCFKFDAEDIHDLFINIGEKLGKSKISKSITSLFFNYKNPILKQKVLGINFSNPVGLAAGFDYDGRLTRIISKVGFGYSTIGSVTRGFYEGNKKPRLARLIKSKSIWVNKGLKNAGADKIISRIKNDDYDIPVGVSIAKTNCDRTADELEGIRDYVSCLKLFNNSGIGDYYEINISCPNAFGGEPFTTPKKLDNLLKEIDKLKVKKPILLKMPVDLSINETKKLCDVAVKHKVDGLIFGNLTKNRNNPLLDKREVSRLSEYKGAFSGLPTNELSNNLIKFAYKNYGNRFVIIGCGGVFSCFDAYKKIKLGASLVQLITGMIYNGPSIIGEINEGLIKLLKRDGYKNISEAVGVDNR